MLKNIFMWILTNVFKVQTETTQKEVADNQKYVEEYENINTINFNAIFGGKLANYVRNESSIKVEGNNKRVELIDDIAQKLWFNMKKIIAMAFGTGGVVLVPYVKNNKIYYDVVSQNRLTINETNGEDIVSATILADEKKIIIGNIQKTFFRWTNYKVINNKITITQKYTDEQGKEIQAPEFWKDIEQEMQIQNVDKVLFGYLKCPRDNRKTDNKYGVPITYGAEETIEKIKKTLKQIEREFDLKEVFVGADATMFGKTDNGKLVKEGLPENGLYKKIDSGKDDFWELFDPSIRESSFFTKLEKQFAQLEKELLISRGIITDPLTTYQNVDETKRAMQDTSSVIDDMRENIRKALSDFFYSCNVLANAYNLTAEGEYEVNYDWSYYFVESSADTWQQMKEGHSVGVIKDEELRAFVYPNEDVKTREKVIQEIKEKNPTIKDLLGA